MDYEFLIHPRAMKALDGAETETKERIQKKIKEIVTDEFRDFTEYDVRKLRGTENDIYRTRIGGWRILFATRTIVGEEMIQAGIIDADKRSGAYDNVAVADQRANEF